MAISTEKNGWLRVLLLIIPYVLCVGVFQVLGMFIAGADMMHPEAKQSAHQIVIAKTFESIGTFLVLWLFMRFADKKPFIELGFSIKKRTSDIITGILLGLIIMGFGYVFLILLDQIKFSTIIFSALDFIYAILLFVIVAVVEEVLLRGYILRNLMASFNNVVALLISSLLFSLMHGLNPNVDAFALFNIFLAGILLGISYIYTKNLWFPIALHFSWNFFQSLFGFNVSGQDFYSLIEFNLPSSNLLNGGAFGFEGSYLSIVAQCITIFSIWFYYNKKQKQELHS